MSERIGLASLPSDGKLSRSAHSLRVVHALREAIVSGSDGGRRAARGDRDRRARSGSAAGRSARALHELHAQGLVEITPTGRSSVVGFDHERLLDLLAVRWQLESQAVRWGLERGHSLGRRVRGLSPRIEAADGRLGRGARRARHGVPPRARGVLGQPRADERLERAGARRDRPCSSSRTGAPSSRRHQLNRTRPRHAHAAHRRRSWPAMRTSSRASCSASSRTRTTCGRCARMCRR